MKQRLQKLITDFDVYKYKSSFERNLKANDINVDLSFKRLSEQCDKEHPLRNGFDYYKDHVTQQLFEMFINNHLKLFKKVK